jgi:hypothetical protein
MPKVQSVVNLIRVARQYPANALAPEYHQSCPIPVPGPAGLRAGFLYGRGLIVEPGGGLQLQVPEYLALVHVETGAFEEMKAVKQGEYGVNHSEGEFLGRYLTLPERMTPEFMTRQLRFYQAYDAVLPSFAEHKALTFPDVSNAAAEFKALFPQVTEGPWLPYYQAIGKAFFSWLG